MIHQMTLDDFHLVEAVVENSLPVIEREPYQFETLFTDRTGLEELHNENSMVILGDSLEVMKQIKSNSVNLIFADAPYNIGKDFGNNQDKWDNVQSYISWCRSWIDECLRILCDTGTMYFMTATQHMPYFDFAFVLRFFSFTSVFPLYSSATPVLRSPISKYSSFISMPIPIRPKRAATADVVKEPANGSNTISPSFDEALMIRSSNASGFCVG